MQIKFDGKALEKALSKLEAKSESKIANTASRAGAAMYRKELKADLPRDAEKRAGLVGGKPKKDVRLVNSLGIKRFSKTAVQVGVVGPARHYAHLIEFGYRNIAPGGHWRKAFDTGFQRYLAEMGKRAWTEIKKHG
jgi:hypothetical protein